MRASRGVGRRNAKFNQRQWGSSRWFGFKNDVCSRYTRLRGYVVSWEESSSVLVRFSYSLAHAAARSSGSAVAPPAFQLDQELPCQYLV